MKKRHPLFIILILGAMLFIALLLAQYMLRERSTIQLPERPAETGSSDSSNDSGKDEQNILTITPKNVQAAVATLSRPSSYQRTQTVTLYWNGGESSSSAQVAVSGGVTRVDTALPDGSICHTLLSGGSFAVWYDDETNWTSLSTDQLSADALQRMPTYETVLDLPVDSIVHAEYCLKDGVYCIYIQTAPDPEGYATGYWISTQSGLLFSAERTSGTEVIYRFSATEPGRDAPDSRLFLLPDGSRF